MMWKIRCAVGEIVCVEEGERIDKERSNSDRYH